MREYIAIYDGECIKLDKEEVDKMKKQFRINYAKNKKNAKSISDEKHSIAIKGNELETKETEHIVQSEVDTLGYTDITNNM